jgi:hypothetical protein
MGRLRQVLTRNLEKLTSDGLTEAGLNLLFEFSRKNGEITELIWFFFNITYKN